MFAGLLALIPALASLFSSGAGAAAAGTAAGAAGTAGAGAAGGATAGGLGGLLGGLFGSGGGAGAAGSSMGGLGGLLSLFGQGGGGGPQQLSGPGMEGVTGAVGPGNGPQPAGPSTGGFNLGSFLGGGTAPGAGSGIQPAGQNMMADLMGGIGRAYMQGALAGKGDFRGALGSLDQQAATANQTARTGIAQQESTRRQEQFDVQKAQQAKVDAANAKIAGIFENPDALKPENIQTTIAAMIPHLIAAGNHQGAHDSLNLLTTAQKDENTNTAMQIAGGIAQRNTKPDGTFDWTNAQKELNTLGNPSVSKMFDTAIVPTLRAQREEANSQNLAKSREANQAHQLANEQNAQTQIGLSERRANESERHNRATEERLGTALSQRMGLGPVPPAQLPQYINKNGGNPQQDPALNQGNPTHGDLVQSGYARVPQPVQVQLKQSNIALTQLDRLQGLTDELFKGVTPGKNLLNAAKLKGQETVASGKVREFQTLLLETIPSMAVASGLTPGRVGETVLEKIEKPMMPNLTDTQETVNGKLRQLKQRLENNREVFFGQGAKMGGASAGVTKLQRNSKTGKLEEVTQ